MENRRYIAPYSTLLRLRSITSLLASPNRFQKRLATLLRQVRNLLQQGWIPPQLSRFQVKPSLKFSTAS